MQSKTLAVPIHIKIYYIYKTYVSNFIFSRDNMHV